MKYKYKGAVALAALISAGACGGAWAQSYDGSNIVTTTDAPSAVFVNYAFDAAGNPLHNDQLNPDGTFKAPCPGCYIKSSTTLTPAEQAAVDADSAAVKFDSKTGRYINTTTDSTTGDAYSQTTTNGGVFTGSKIANGSGDSLTTSARSATFSNAAGNNTDVTAAGVTSTDASGNQSVFTANGVTVVNTSGASSTVTAGGASFTDASGGNTTIAGGDVTSTGTISGAKVLAGGRDVGQSLADHDATLANHDTRITHVQNQADATDHRLNDFNGTGGTVESWATGVDNWRIDTNAWRDDVNTTLSNYGSRISSLEGWRNVASAQISNLQGRMDKVEGGIALAMASKVPSLETGKTFGVTLNTAFTDSTGAIAGGVAFRLDKNWQINASGGAGFKGGAAGGTVGIVGQW